MNPVTFARGSDYVAVNGVEVAHISRAPECYVSVVTGTKPWIACPWRERITIARFKYAQPRKHAREWCKIVFAALPMAEVVRLINEERMTPMAVLALVESR